MVAQGSQAGCEEIIASSMDAIISTDDEQRIVLFNPAAETMFRCSSTDAIGHDISRFIPERFRAAHREHVRRFGESGVTSRTPGSLGTIEGLRADGEEFPAEASISVAHVAGHKMYTVILRDITERTRLEEKLRQAQKMEALGALAGGIAHGFNNILTAIVGHIDLALRAPGVDGETRHDLEQAHVAAMRGGALARQILAFSRQGQGERAPVELARIVTDTLALLRPTLPANIDVRHRSTAASTWLQADSTQVQQILLNFFDNAVFAMRGTGGVLDLALDEVPVGNAFAAAHPPLEPGPYVRLTVRDTGCGMTPAIMARIFDPFFTTKRPGEGTGLSLAAAYGIVSDHGGVITVASEPNQGTAFEVYLPLLPKGGPPAVDAHAQPVLGGTERILFVDDEASLTRLGQRYLTPLGYTVVAEMDSLAALDRFRQSPDQFDLVITDLTMPKLTGTALAAELLRIRPNLPIILCTGGGVIMPPEDLRRLGIRAFLTKPYALPDLAAAIRRVLDHQAG